MASQLWVVVVPRDPGIIRRAEFDNRIRLNRAYHERLAGIRIDGR